MTLLCWESTHAWEEGGEREREKEEKWENDRKKWIWSGRSGRRSKAICQLTRVMTRIKCVGGWGGLLTLQFIRQMLLFFWTWLTWKKWNKWHVIRATTTTNLQFKFNEETLSHFHMKLVLRFGIKISTFTHSLFPSHGRFFRSFQERAFQQIGRNNLAFRAILCAPFSASGEGGKGGTDWVAGRGEFVWGSQEGRQALQICPTGWQNYNGLRGKFLKIFEIPKG